MGGEKREPGHYDEFSARFVAQKINKILTRESCVHYQYSTIFRCQPTNSVGDIHLSWDVLLVYIHIELYLCKRKHFTRGIRNYLVQVVC